MVLGIIYFITLVSFLGDVLNLKKNNSEPLGMTKFIFLNSWQLLATGFKAVEMDAILGTVKV
jgi:hypothetical protein